MPRDPVAVPAGAGRIVKPAPAGLPAPTNLSAQLLIEARAQLAWTAHSTDEDGFAIWRKTLTSDWAQRAEDDVAHWPATTRPGLSPHTRARLQAVVDDASRRGLLDRDIR